MKYYRCRGWSNSYVHVIQERGRSQQQGTTVRLSSAAYRNALYYAATLANPSNPFTYPPQQQNSPPSLPVTHPRNIQQQFHVDFINSNMAHRLQHLQKRRVQQSEQANPQRQEAETPSNFNTSSPVQGNNTQHLPQRPIFDPTNTVQPYDRNGYKKGDLSFPPPESLYVGKDTEIDPCFLRATSAALHTLPRKTNLPTAVWITPFANEQVNVVEVRSPLRCTRCKGYVNPYFQFDGTRRSVTCNLCGLRFNIQENVDKNNIQCAEISTQSIIDFRVSDKFYFKKRTDIVKVLVVIELSMSAMEMGIVATVISSLKSTFESHEFESKIRLGVVFYSDQGVGFLRKGGEGQEPTIFLVPNNKNNLFCCPLSDDDLLFDPNLERQQLSSTLDFLQGYVDNLITVGKFSHQANYVNAIRSIKQLFQNETGRIILFSFLDPRAGSCSIRMRNEEEGKLPLKPISADFYELAKELQRSRIGVDHFYFSKDNMLTHELATTHFLTSITGGELHLYNSYNNDTHSQHLYYNIFHTFTRPVYYDADFTCRSSTGINVLRYGVPDGLRESRDVGQSIVTNTSSYTIQLDQEEKLQEHSGAYIQFALMYTNGSGERRIRVINYKFDVSSRLEVVYDSLDYLTLANIIAKTYTHRLLKADPAKCREDAITWLGSLIGDFRSKCPQGATAKLGDMVIPQKLVWMFSYLHVILNSKLFLSHIKATPDQRINEYLKLHSSNPYFFATRYYPHVYPLTLDIYDQQPLPGDFIENENEPEDAAKIAILPRNLILTKKQFQDDGLYLYDAADQLIILVQSQAGQELLTDLFATTNWQQIQAQGLPQLQTSHNIRTNNIISQIRRRSSQYGGMYQPLLIKTPMKKGAYGELFQSILKQDYYECTFPAFIDSIKRVIVVPK